MKPANLPLQCLLLALLLWAIPAQAGDHDFQWWTWESITYDLSDLSHIKGHQLYLRNENRFDDDVTNHGRWHWDVGMQLPVPGLQGWTLRPVYRHITNNVNSSRESREDRYYFDLAHNWKDLGSGDWDFKLRLRHEIRDIHARNDIIHRLRAQFQLSHPTPVRIGEKPVEFYVYEEPHYDFDADRWNRNWLGAGFNAPLNPYTAFKLGYLLQSDRKNNHWRDDSMLLTGVEMKF